MKDIVWNGDKRYPGPKAYLLPDFIKGVPSQDEIEAMPDMFTWGEIKEQIRRRNNNGMSRNKELEDKYEEWIEGQKEEWGSAVDYLIHARLPWGKGKKKQQPKSNTHGQSKEQGEGGNNDKNNSKDKDSSDTEDTKDANDQDDGDDDTASDASSEADASDSMAYISFEEIDERQRKLGKPPLSEGRPDDKDLQPFLTWDSKKGLDTKRYAILPNDWPYCLPYGVRHYVIWCRIAIAHPVLVGYDAEDWEEIEEQGLQGFTGVTPLYDKQKSPPDVTKDWYTVDVEHAGSEVNRWAGLEFETRGGQEVGKMVRGLWDERGWETVWFVNPPSIPGYAHFHIFARRKRPIEIDVSERVYADLKL